MLLHRAARQDGGVSERPELAVFLRARREGLRPGDVGLPDSGRRRTPGLRREELATLAGVSIDYLIRLEQGRDLHPSPSVVAALAKALLLREDETLHLLKLAAIGHTRELCPTATPLGTQVPPSVRKLLDSLNQTPAFVVGPISDVLAWNPAWEQLATPLGLLDGSVPNVARYVFTHPDARAVHLDWSAAADEQVSTLRAAELRWGADPIFGALLEELRSIPEFASRWSAHTVEERRRGVKTLRHPGVGEMRIAYEVLLLPDDEQWLTIWLPADDAAAASFQAALTGTFPVSPAKLRVVASQ
jgi:transcriptional regulator with XRE-family HTH domain